LKKIDQFYERFRIRKAFTTRDVISEGFHRNYIIHAKKKWGLTQISSGLYSFQEKEVIEEIHDIILITKQYPHARLCLVSALDYYGLTDERPDAYQFAITINQTKPRSKRVPIKIFYFSEERYKSETITGVEFTTYIPAKVILDCFQNSALDKNIAIKALIKAYPITIDRGFIMMCKRFNFLEEFLKYKIILDILLESKQLNHK
jgi:predicted transcriptional regulator of viral defense system